MLDVVSQPAVSLRSIRHVLEPYEMLWFEHINKSRNSTPISPLYLPFPPPPEKIERTFIK